MHVGGRSFFTAHYFFRKISYEFVKVKIGHNATNCWSDVDADGKLQINLAWPNKDELFILYLLS